MTATAPEPLGPCPVCGFAGSHSIPMIPAHTVMCGGCTFQCTTEHWNLLRRKMTLADANELIEVMGGENRFNENQTHAVRVALTGEA